MVWSDVLAGAALVVLGWRSLKPNHPISLWACCFVGIWLTSAPMFFWAPTSAAYLNDSLVGILVMALTILIPGMPNMIMYMQMGRHASGLELQPVQLAAALDHDCDRPAGLFVSRYLAMFQLGYTDYVWDPFFGFASARKGSQFEDVPCGRSPMADWGRFPIRSNF